MSEYQEPGQPCRPDVSIEAGGLAGDGTRATDPVEATHPASPAITGAPPPGACYTAPRTAADTGLDYAMLLSLVLKTAYLHRHATLRMFLDVLKLPASVLQEVAGTAVREHLLEIARRGTSDLEVHYRLTDAGHARAAELSARCSYVGPAPVTLQAYCDAVAQHSVRHAAVTREQVTAAFRDFVIPGDLLDAVGTSLNTCRALLIYGPPGSGKTFLAQQLGALLPGAVPVPYAVAVAGEIVQVFDPLVHTPIYPDGDGEAGAPASVTRLPLDRRPVDRPMDRPIDRPSDRRWQLCRRPVVLTGGELTLSMLEMRHDTSTGFYQAPPHMKANNGVFIIDDLGRQLAAVNDLLNRWIVPLDRRVDLYTLHTGVRFAVPFDAWPVFSTNLEPRHLGDDAFLRRLGSKLYVGPMSADDYREVFHRTATELGLSSTGPVFDYLLESLHYANGAPLLACIPRDLLRLVASEIRYHGDPPHVTEAALRRAWESYFGLQREFDPTPPPGTGRAWPAGRLAAI